MYSVALYTASNIPADLNPLIIVSFFVIVEQNYEWDTQEDEEENVDNNGGLEEEDDVLYWNNNYCDLLIYTCLIAQLLTNKS